MSVVVIRILRRDAEMQIEEESIPPPYILLNYGSPTRARHLPTRSWSSKQDLADWGVACSGRCQDRKTDRVQFIKREGQFLNHNDQIYKKLGQPTLDELRGAVIDLCVGMIDKGGWWISTRATTSLMGKPLET